MNFSFFYSRGSAGYVRGEQMADYLKGKKNPESCFEDDVCIYVKILPPDNPPKRSYCDVDDSEKSAQYLKTHLEVGVIANSQTAKDYLAKLLGRKDIVIIPHAYCNYERWVRPDREVKTVGIIGSITSFQYPLDKFRDELKKIGLELLYDVNYWDVYQYNRLKVCDFYKKIDIQVVWRPQMVTPYFKNPNKLVNAGSFGIPTVAYPERSFVNGWLEHFIKVGSIEEMVMQIKMLKDHPGYYKKMSELALKKAEENHIEKIAELYRKL